MRICRVNIRYGLVLIGMVSPYCCGKPVYYSVIDIDGLHTIRIVHGQKTIDIFHCSNERSTLATIAVQKQVIEFIWTIFILEKYLDLFFNTNINSAKCK